MVGQTLGGYRIVAQLGQGGMGAVYLAEHQRIDRKAAVKVLLPQFSQDAGVVSRFFTEARATSKIRHPGIVEIFDCDVQADGRAYIIMEYLEGESLAARLARTRTISDPETREILRQIASALGAAHGKGIAHRDMKPDNVFLSTDPEQPGRTIVKILDFGIAKLFGSTLASENKTRTGSILGTPVYMSPEQCKGAGHVDHRTDIYSLGCIIFEMLSGRPPFVHAGMGETIAAHIYEPPPRLLSVAPNAPPDIDALVTRLLAKDPAARPQTMAEIAAALETAPVSTRPGSTPPSPPSNPNLGPTMRLPVATPPATEAPKLTTLRGATGAMAVTEDELVPARPRRAPLVIGGAAVATVAAVAIIFAATRSKETAEPVAAAPPAAPVVAPTPPEPPPRPALPSTVTLRVANAPPGLTVTVDGVLGAVPIKLPRDTEAHRLVFTAPGFEREEQVVNASKDQSIELALRKAPEPRRQEPARHRTKPTTAKRPSTKKQTDGITDL
jgi:eukaryotic-like serine/threonine-protein kinase